MYFRRLRPVLAASLCVLAGCGTSQQLSRYEFAGYTLAVLHVSPTAGELRMGGYATPDGAGGARALVQAGSRVALEVEGRRVRARLDSAATQVPVGARMAQRTAERATMYLGTRQVAAASSADYLLDLRVRSFGVSARNWQSAAQLYVEADVVLIEAISGTEIWTTQVRSWDYLTPRVASAGPVPRDLITAAGLAAVPVTDLQRALELVSDRAADAVTDALREKLRSARR